MLSYSCELPLNAWNLQLSVLSKGKHLTFDCSTKLSEQSFHSSKRMLPWLSNLGAKQFLTCPRVKSLFITIFWWYWMFSHDLSFCQFYCRCERSLQYWILIFYIILAHKMVQISDPRLYKWVERGNFPTWLDDICFSLLILIC